MKVLMICNLPEEYNTSSVLCSNLICRGWVENGHTVFLATPNPDKNHKYYCDDYDYSTLKVTRIRFGKTIEKSYEEIAKKNGVKSWLFSCARSIYKKFDLFGSSVVNIRYYPEIIAQLSDMKIEPDIIVSASNPKTSHILANKVVKSIGKGTIKYVQYWGDPLAADIAVKTWTPFYVRKIVEMKVIKPADKIVYVSPLTEKLQSQLFPRFRNKITYLPTPCEFHEYGEVRGLCLGYFGSYNSTVRDIMPLYNSVIRKKECKLIIVGDSDIQLEPAENVTIIGRVSQAELEKYFSQCNVLVNLTNYKGSQIPAKIFRDAGTNREVLLICDSRAGENVRQYFEDYGRYTICDNTEAEIERIVDKYLVEGVIPREPLMDFNYQEISLRLLDY